MRVRGVFPRTGSLQFIDGQRIDEAVARPLVEDPTAPLVMGVDIARQGADQSVIRFRRGLDARSIPAVKFRIPDLMQIASRVMEQVNSHNPDAVFAARYANKRAEMERRFDEGLKRLKRWVV